MAGLHALPDEACEDGLWLVALRLHTRSEHAERVDQRVARLRGGAEPGEEMLLNEPIDWHLPPKKTQAGRASAERPS